MTAGAGSGAASAGSRVAGADEAARRGAGSARRGGRGLGRGALTVTSGSVSDIWPQAGPGEVSPPGNGNAPKATAPKSRRLQTPSRDELRPTPHAPNITPPATLNSRCQVELVNGF